MTVEIGLTVAEREELVDGLCRMLADTYTLYLKTHNFHWNVTGPMFRTLHLLFEEQYVELSDAVDAIAERIRALGHPAPGSYSQFASLSSVKEEPGVPEPEGMISQLKDGQEQIARSARALLAVCNRLDDAPSADLVTQRMQVHEKNAWVLRSMMQ